MNSTANTGTINNANSVIFVHGLNGGSARTWTKKSFFWPLQLLPQILPHARIMMFGYNANIFEFCEEGRIKIFAGNLYNEIEVRRQTSQELERPILFICHSMGGLVAKKCMVIAHNKNPNMSILDHGRSGFIFLATPHHGADSALLAQFLNKVANTLFLNNVRSDSAKELRRFSQTCEDIHDEFVSLSSHTRFACFSFFELRPYPGIGMIVKQESALMNIECEKVRFGLHANHRDVCRFPSATDDNFRTLLPFIGSIAMLLGVTALSPSKSDISPEHVTLLRNDGDEDDVAITDGASFGDQKEQNVMVHTPKQLVSATGTLTPTPMSIGPADETVEHPMAPTLAIKSRNDGITNDLPLFRPRNFFGRHDILDQMEAHYQDKTVDDHAFGLYGLIGVGKSQVALKYTDLYKRRFKYRFWVYADTEEKITKSMIEIAQQIGLSTATQFLSPGNAANAIRNWLRQNSNWLLVFDNVTNTDLVGPYWPKDYHTDCYIIMTSREITLTWLMSAHSNLECFTEEEGTDWFWSIVSSDGRPAREKNLVIDIVRLLGGHPLALGYFATSISNSGQSLDDFLMEYRSNSQLLMMREADFFNKQDLFADYVAYLSQLPEEADDLLDVIAFFSPDKIHNIDLFGHSVRDTDAEAVNMKGSDSATGRSNTDYGTTLSPVLYRDGRQQTALKKLILMSLVDKAKKNPAEALSTALPASTSTELRLHRMTQIALRSRLQLQPERQYRAFSNALHIICKSFPRHVTLGTSMIDLYPECEKFVEHLLSILDFYEMNKGSPKLVVNHKFAEALAHCGWYFFERGETDSSLRVLHAAEAMCEPNTATYGLVQNNLGAVYMLRREEEKALGYTKRAIAAREQSIPPDDPEIQQLAFSYTNIANDLQLVEPVDRDLCEQYYKRALDIGENGPGKTPHSRQFILCNAAFAYYRWGRLDEAYNYIKRAIALHDDCGAHTTFTLYGLYYYGNIMWAIGDQQAAYKIHSKCLKERVKLQSNAHYTTGVSFHKMGRLAYELRELVDAKNYLASAEVTFRDYRDDPGLWPRTCILLGRVMMELGQLSEDDMLCEGQVMFDQGLAVARKLRSDIGDGKDADKLDFLVREVYR